MQPASLPYHAFRFDKTHTLPIFTFRNHHNKIRIPLWFFLFCEMSACRFRIQREASDTRPTKGVNSGLASISLSIEQHGLRGKC